MSPDKLPTAISRVAMAFACSVLIVGPAGCDSSLLNIGVPGTSNPFGLLINTDLTSDLLGAVRLGNGENVFLYGKFLESGLIERIDGASYRNAEGQVAKVELANGFVTKATSFDGSTLTMNYEEISTQRLKGTVEIVFAGIDGDDGTQTIPFDIDLAQAVADVTSEIENYLGIDISQAVPPTNPVGKVRLPDVNKGHKTSNPDQVAQLILAFVSFHRAAFGAIGYVIVQLMGGLINVMANLLVGIVTVVTQAVVVALFTPFILMGEVLRVAVLQPVYTVDLEVDLNLSPPGFR
ncbi:MAG: hypothetical protein H6819_02545 [Phycisphaerales bacterium]|nr:hypothetical protein [Phycisphaerales bacterium]MCB9856908.1 hypothetical protein [Phycisphaerales bacterium]MCB9861965.1 hypothetical protein [Phycisphaerales bacterium]